MALRQHIEQKQQQKLSPLQIQVIKLTELPTLELEDRIRQELEDNPSLEEGVGVDDQNNDDLDEELTAEDIAMGDYKDEDDMPDYQLAPFERKDQRKEIPTAGSDSLHEYLLNQIREINLSVEDKKIVEYIIGSIDESGYLDRGLNAISDDLIFQQNIETSVDHLESLLEVVQSFDPAGIAARNLQECLSIQLKRKTPTDINQIALQVIEEYFDEFSKRHYDKIMKSLNINEETLKQAIDEILALNPKPGSDWDDSLTTTLNTIIPDFIVDIHDGELLLSLNDKNVPPLWISNEYSNLLSGYVENKESMNADNKDAAIFIKQKLDSARWFIEAIRQRQETLQRTMQAIINIQYDFFLTGEDINLRPMILKDVAEATSYDISTISRVSNSKYVQTNFGVYSLKYFFSESMQTDSGEEISSREIKSILQECIDNENKQKPLTDEELTDALQEKGYLIARRTVSKYREQLNLPISRLRKEI